MSVMGFYQSFYALGIFLGPLLAGKIAQLVGLAGVFYGAGSLAFAAFFVIFFRQEGARGRCLAHKMIDKTPSLTFLNGQN